MENRLWIILGIAVFLTIVVAAGCRVFTSRKAPEKKVIAENVELNKEWLEITPKQTLNATTRIHFVGLKLPNISGYADDKQTKLKLVDGSEVSIEIELIDNGGVSSRLFPNGIGEYVDFGKRTVNDVPSSSYFHPGEQFTKMRLRSNKSLTVDEIVWREFEF